MIVIIVVALVTVLFGAAFWLSCGAQAAATAGPLDNGDADYAHLAVKGNYEAVPGHKPIGSGAYGTVQVSRKKSSRLRVILLIRYFLASEPEESLVAIKYLRYSGDTKKNAEMDSALKKEIRPLTNCKHRNILLIHGIWRNPLTQELGIVTQYATEGALNTFLKQKPSIVVVTNILRDVATGLRYLHTLRTGEKQVGIAHGDLHPGNVLLMREGDGLTAVLGDFGLCKLVDENGLTSLSQRKDGIAGIAAYLGPELYGNGELGPRVTPQVQQDPKYRGLRTIKGDVFAFGMLSFTTLGGDLKKALYDGIPGNPSVFIAISIVEGNRPSRQHLPLDAHQAEFRSDIEAYWPTIEDCWQDDAARRPAIETVLEKIPTLS